MKFDTIIIGGGLSGLVAGIELTRHNQRCVIISSGQSAVHFSSGSFDLLNTLPDGSPVTNPQASISDLIKQNPAHPYSKLGSERFVSLSEQSESFFREIGLNMEGRSDKNHYYITPMGALKSTWLTSLGFATSDNNQSLPWKKVTIFNIKGYQDFYPEFISDEIYKLGTESQIKYLTIPELEHLYRNPSELRSTNIARQLDQITNIDYLVDTIKSQSQDSEAILIPSIMGLHDNSLLSRIKELVDKPIYQIPTMPPSLVGIHIQQYLHDYFISQGGTYMLGDNVQKGDIHGNTLERIYTYNHGDIPFSAPNIILATGSYFSQGLIATRETIYEPIFNLDVTPTSSRETWYDKHLFNAQPYQSYGVQTDAHFRALKDGHPIDNLYVSGAILDGFNPVQDGSGSGVSILSSLHIAEQIISKSK